MNIFKVLCLSAIAAMALPSRADVDFRYSVNVDAPLGDVVGEVVTYLTGQGVVTGTQYSSDGTKSVSSSGTSASINALGDPALGVFKASSNLSVVDVGAFRSGSASAYMNVSDTLRFSGAGNMVNATFEMNYSTSFDGLKFDPFVRADQYDHFLDAFSRRYLQVSYEVPNPLYDPTVVCVDGDNEGGCPIESQQFITEKAETINQVGGGASLHPALGSSEVIGQDWSSRTFTDVVRLSVMVPTNLDVRLLYQVGIFSRCVGMISCSVDIDSSHSDYLGLRVAGGDFVSANGYQYLGVPSAVPEAATYAMLALGLAGIGIASRRRPRSGGRARGGRTWGSTRSS